MDLKETLQNFLKLAETRRVDSRLLILVGALGMLIIASAAWFTFSDQRSGQTASQSAVQGQKAVEQLAQPVQSLKRMLNDENVQALAARAINNPDALDDLNSYLNGRISEISDVRVFGSNLNSVNPEDLGANGFAAYDMLLDLQGNNQSRLQVHYSLAPPRMVDAVRVSSGDDLTGYMIVMLAPDYLLSHFDPDYSQLGYIGLSQYNGRQAPNTLAEVGEQSLAGEVPERLPVPGTMFRIVYPQKQYISVLGGSLLVTMLLVGIVLLIGSVLLYFVGSKLAKLKQPPEVATAPRPTARLEADMPGDREVAPAATAMEEKPVVEQTMDQQIADQQTLGQQTEDQQAGDQQAGQGPEASDTQPDPPAMRLRYDIAERRKAKEAAHEAVDLIPGIFRAYDIRGVIYKTLDAGIAKKVGQAVGTVVLDRDAGPVVVARDGRLSGPYLHNAMIEGITSSGCDVLDVGAVPTGVLYYAAHEMAAGSGVMITGSHNPPDYNGFKIMVGGDPLHGEQISDFYRRITEEDVRVGTGTVKRENVVSRYIERIAEDIQLERPLRVVIDCGNGIGGVCAAEVLRAIGAEVLPLFDEVDGTFPNHHPDPSEPENLNDLIESVRLMDADIGFALDGDADRLGVVTLAGNIIYPDRVMMLLAMDVLDRNPGATIIYDVKCTGHLAEVIRQAGGEPLMYKTGHSLIKSKMKEIGSPFAGEMSGHFFFEERWYGVDDGIYAAARLLEILAGAETPPEAILNALPTSFSTPELKVPMEEGENFAFVEEFKKVARFDDAKISTIDGIRADWPDGWGLVRCSNTTPILVVRFDAETEEALDRIKTTFRSQMLSLRADLQLPF
jgi:phosphomannomutase